jgi:gamma-glutamyltranspeptidase
MILDLAISFILLPSSVFVFGNPAGSQFYLGPDNDPSINTGGPDYGSAVPAVDCQLLSNEILAAGGSTVDASITSALCTGLINSYASGMGGGAFMVIKPGTGDPIMIDCRETGPELVSPSTILTMFGGMASGVPGELHCFETAHKMYGKLPWKDLFTGVVRLARYGFVVPLNLAKRLRHFETYILAQETLAAIYAPSGTLLDEGEVCIKNKLADLLEQISVSVFSLI